jgi:hypothetical protein
MPVMCVTNHSFGGVIWRHISAYIVESIHISVICAVNHSVWVVIWRCINAYIDESIHILIMCLINYTVERERESTSVRVIPCQINTENCNFEPWPFFIFMKVGNPGWALSASSLYLLSYHGSLYYTGADQNDIHHDTFIIILKPKFHPNSHSRVNFRRRNCMDRQKLFFIHFLQETYKAHLQSLQFWESIVSASPIKRVKCYPLPVTMSPVGTAWNVQIITAHDYIHWLFCCPKKQFETLSTNCM